jgi:hypothetical protein
MSRLDSLKEARRGIGVTCQCSKSARITVRSRTLCYETTAPARGSAGQCGRSVESQRDLPRRVPLCDWCR